MTCMSNTEIADITSAYFSYNGTTSSGGSDKESSSDYSDWEMDNKTILQPPSRRSTSGRKINPPRTLSPSLESSQSGSLTKQRQAARKQRKASTSRSVRASRKAKVCHDFQAVLWTLKFVLDHVCFAFQRSIMELCAFVNKNLMILQFSLLCVRNTEDANLTWTCLRSS